MYCNLHVQHACNNVSTLRSNILFIYFSNLFRMYQLRGARMFPFSDLIDCCKLGHGQGLKGGAKIQNYRCIDCIAVTVCFFWCIDMDCLFAVASAASVWGGAGRRKKLQICLVSTVSITGAAGLCFCRWHPQLSSVCIVTAASGLICTSFAMHCWVPWLSWLNFAVVEVDSIFSKLAAVPHLSFCFSIVGWGAQRNWGNIWEPCCQLSPAVSRLSCCASAAAQLLLVFLACTGRTNRAHKPVRLQFSSMFSRCFP